MPWRALFVSVYGGLNLPIILLAIGADPLDWRRVGVDAGLVRRRTLYDGHFRDVPFVWSPIIPLLIAPLIPLGFTAWAGLHVAALAFLKPRWLIAVTLVSFAFWSDVAFGNTLVFVFVAGTLALRGSRNGAWAYILLCALMPRPLQLPLFVYLMWKRADLRLPAAVIFAAHSAVVLATGYGPEWLAALVLLSGGAAYESVTNWGPTHLIGSAWLLVGIPLAAWLTWRGRVGYAALAITPYLLVQYPLLALWDLIRTDRQALGRPHNAEILIQADEFEPVGVRVGGGSTAIPIRSVQATTTRLEQDGYAVPMDLAPARVLSSAGNDGGHRPQEDRIGAKGVHE
jgi:hypothetical protein